MGDRKERKEKVKVMEMTATPVTITGREPGSTTSWKKKGDQLWIILYNTSMDSQIEYHVEHLAVYVLCMVQRYNLLSILVDVSNKTDI